MSSLKLAGIIGTGGIGVLAAGLLASKVLNTGLEGTFGSALMIFVIAGAASLVLRTVL